MYAAKYPSKRSEAANGRENVLASDEKAMAAVRRELAEAEEKWRAAGNAVSRTREKIEFSKQKPVT